MDDTVRPALLWERLASGAVRCALCAHRCRVAEGRRGLCGVRENRGGSLHTLVYGALRAANVDPIEKKPLFHFQPGSRSYSIATAGCNLRCAHCQNHSLSQVPRRRGPLPERFVPPEDVVEAAKDAGCRSISYTYGEPTVFFEYALACMTLARSRGLSNVFVTNGAMTRECLDLAIPYLDAANVDLKAMSDSFYRKVCGGRLAPVLDTLRELRRRGVWLEVTTLVIPRHNDSPTELRDAARFVAGLGADVPWHVTGFHPTYRLQAEPPTTAECLSGARRIGLEEGLHFVYAGNRPGTGGENTACPACGALVLERRGFRVQRRSLTAEGACAGCGRALPGIDLGGAP